MKQVDVMWKLYHEDGYFKKMIDAHSLEYGRYRKSTIKDPELKSVVAYLITELPMVACGTQNLENFNKFRTLPQRNSLYNDVPPSVYCQSIS